MEHRSQVRTEEASQTLIAWLTVLVRFLPYEVTRPTLSTQYLWKEVQPHLRCGKFYSVSLRVESLHKFAILLLGTFAFSPTCIYPVIYLYQYGLKDIHFILWVLIQ